MPARHRPWTELRRGRQPAGLRKTCGLCGEARRPSTRPLPAIPRPSDGHVWPWRRLSDPEADRWLTEIVPVGGRRAPRRCLALGRGRRRSIQGAPPRHDEEDKAYAYWSEDASKKVESYDQNTLAG